MTRKKHRSEKSMKPNQDSKKTGSRKNRAGKPGASRKQNRLSMFLAVLVVVVLVIAVAVSAVSVKRKLNAAESRKADLEQQISDEKARTKEIEEYKDYTTTDEYVEEIARDKLGLVHEGEVIFKEKKNN